MLTSKEPRNTIDVGNAGEKAHAGLRHGLGQKRSLQSSVRNTIMSFTWQSS